MYSFIIALFTILTDLLTEVQFQNHCMKKNLQDSQHTETLFDFISKMMNFVRARIQPLIFIGPLSVPIENCTRNFKHFRTVQQLKCNGKGSSSLMKPSLYPQTHPQQYVRASYACIDNKTYALWNSKCSFVPCYEG